ncbi:hypothetical protein ACTL32_10490 [Planococcus sp. FY231025]
MINRLIDNKMEEIIYEIESNAFIAANDVAEVISGSFKKRDID